MTFEAIVIKEIVRLVKIKIFMYIYFSSGLEIAETKLSVIIFDILIVKKGNIVSAIKNTILIKKYFLEALKVVKTQN